MELFKCNGFLVLLDSFFKLTSIFLEVKNAVYLKLIKKNYQSLLCLR